MKNNILMFLVFISGFAIANMDGPKNDVKMDDTEALIAQGMEQMAILGERSEQVNKAVRNKFETMKQTIEVLEEKNEMLVEQVKVMENEIVAIKAEPIAQPFNVLAIGVPDSAR